MSGLRDEIDRILGESPEHNRTDEHEAVVDEIMSAIERHGADR